METRQSARKRKNSSMSNSRSESPVASRTRRCGTTTSMSEESVPATKPISNTPRKSRKRVRFSDPGPRLLDNSACSTGLTPAMKRTSFAEPAARALRLRDPTPSRRAYRRQSAPAPRFERLFDPVDPFDETSTERVMQFTPLRQILDTRTQRRIRRIGLSDEINNIEQEKRASSRIEKTLDCLRRERDALQHELNALKYRHELSEDQLPSYETFWMSPQTRNRNIEQETTHARDENTVAFNHGIEDLEPSMTHNDGETFMLNDSTLIVSNSPDFRATRDRLSLLPESLNVLDDVSIKTPVRNSAEDSELYTLSLDLEAARNEKKELFSVCRKHMSAFEDSTMSDVLRQSSPPPDFFDNVINIFTTALSRASDATQALEGISQECSSLGFSGTNADDMVADIKSQFRAARLELERAVPGENAAALGDGKATLGALVKRVKSLAKDLTDEQKHHHGSLDREKALRRHFDNLLHRYEDAANKIGSLEDSIASSASDMLHTRMRLQELESEDQEKNIGIDRLSTALDKYHEDMKGLEDLVSKLEEENLAVKEKYKRQISKLELKVASEKQERSAIEDSAAEYEIRIQKLEETVEQNRIRACDLTAAAEALEKEHEVAVQHIEQKLSERQQQHEEEIGILNVRISELTTSLDGARSEVQRLRRVNTGLEEQLRMEIEARDELLDKWASEQARSFAFMKESVSSERRRAKVRTANWELKSDDLMSDGTTIMGSEPITPVSMTRFIDVEIGRGKNRRRMDSGIGILTEDELDEDVNLSDIQHGLDSDVDLPTIF
ncbi:hypothetical protein N7462_010165 [Penicillium macrosclerotiorum]|uniref:uncharacterized protein n=1 Tax=Penicillium macrosclerotiorum TaxID=303699 RepID=UPI00254857D3|nr:uncharacterized protein N7462_010165 [Penicillium macrosclerotiorum]KAJ5669095.1 hypothetical protein N7462_010165 [Penicillium macrosclerotiorum]